MEIGTEKADFLNAGRFTLLVRDHLVFASDIIENAVQRGALGEVSSHLTVGQRERTWLSMGQRKEQYGG